MKHSTTIWGVLLQQILLALIAANGIAANPAAMSLKAHHNLTLSLKPERSELIGQDQIRILGPAAGAIDLHIASHAEIRTLRLNGNDHPFTFRKGRLTVQPPEGALFPKWNLTVEYTCRFADPAPVNPANTDNPGYGVSGTIGPSGTFILSGAGWYPRIAGAQESYDIVIDGPKGIVAVTAGRMVDIEHQSRRTLSKWRIDNPLEGLSLSAGPYVVDRKERGGLAAATFLYPSSRFLAPRYLTASLGYLDRYSKLFGPYPFDSFAVVENFFPTGYGFPAYTLMGSRVLQLPFIPETSLPHEIVHNWWGNGVQVDFTSGNWCEGLTSYTADYLNKELRSETAARDYRRQAIRNFATLVSPESDVPLSQFLSRSDPATKAVGYDKSAMVFHMLRQTVGETAFWDALRDLYQQFLFRKASWKDLQQAFERHAQRPLDRFFRQWITRPGAPSLRLEDVCVVSDQQGYRTTGRLVQNLPVYDLTLQLALETDGSPLFQTVHLASQDMKFSLSSTQHPRMLIGDPDFHLFRQLTPEEMPPTVNSLKGSSKVVVVIADHISRQGKTRARQFIRALGIDPLGWIEEADLRLSDTTKSDILFIGLPTSIWHTKIFPQELHLATNRFDLENLRFQKPGDLLFCVFRPTGYPLNIVALLHPLSEEAVDRTVRKIPHYGRYSYLAFSDGINRIKGTWEVETSPMKVHLSTTQSP